MALLLLAPGVLGFAGIAAPLAYAFALVYLGLALVTTYPDGGLWRVSFNKLHGRVELASAAAAIAAPWLLSFANDTRERTFFIVAGAGSFVVWSITDYRAPNAGATR